MAAFGQLGDRALLDGLKQVREALIVIAAWLAVVVALGAWRTRRMDA